MSNREIYEADIHIFGTRSGSNNVVIKPAAGKTLTIEGTVSGGGGGGTGAGGSDTEIQFNNAGLLAGDNSFWFDSFTQVATVKNLEVTGYMNYPKRPYGLVLGDNQQVINTDIWTSLTSYWDSATVNGIPGQSPGFSPLTGLFTVQVEGLYHVNGSATFDANVNGLRFMGISIDNENDPNEPNFRALTGVLGTSGGHLRCSCYAYLIPGQTVGLFVRQDSGNALAMSDGNFGEFAVVLVA